MLFTRDGHREHHHTYILLKHEAVAGRGPGK